MGRCVGKDKVERYCTVCGSQQIEDEYHFLYACPKLKPVRKAAPEEFIPDYKSFKKSVKTKILMEADNIKHSGAFIEQMFMKCRDILFNVNVE